MALPIARCGTVGVLPHPAPFMSSVDVQNFVASKAIMVQSTITTSLQSFLLVLMDLFTSSQETELASGIFIHCMGSLSDQVRIYVPLLIP